VTRLGFITGLRTEAAIVEAASETLSQPHRPLIHCGGAHAGRAQAGALRLIEEGAGALVSFGIAGGLAPELASGSLVLASTVRLVGEPLLNIDLAWRDRLCARVRGAFHPELGGIAGSDTVLQTVGEKKGLFEATHALAVDMESHVVARVARDCGIPFLVVRAIADAANATIPDVALAGVGKKGEALPLAVLRRAAFSPQTWPALVRLGRSHKKAHDALRRLLGVAGVSLAFE